MPDDLSGLVGEVTSPIQKLMDLLSPDKQQWLKAQPQERQQKLAQGWANSVFTMRSPGVTSGFNVEDPKLNDHANAFIQDAQDGNG
ncbi:hypothetical protein [Streptomyces sp. NPDC091268]|uniref:hypothetical protein n=1 Tax=Streptomyces sp. NPDC091268 TaxID=3365979 RepID=UPI0037F969CD